MIDPSGFTLPYDYYLCDNLAKLHHEITFYTRTFNQTDELFIANNFRVKNIYYLKSENIRKKLDNKSLHAAIKAVDHWQSSKALASETTLSRPDIIHFQWLPAPLIDNMYLHKLKTIAPLVLTVHDTNPFHGSPTSKLQLLKWPKVIELFDAVIVHTNYSKQNLIEKNIANKRIYIIPHGMFDYSINQNNKGHSKAHTNQKGKSILFFGTIKHYKGLDVLLKAYAKLPAPLKQTCRLTVAGLPKMDIKLLYDLADKLGINDINWKLGFIPYQEVAMLFKSADIVVFPYREIDASGALMTALPFEKPIIASRVGGFPECITDSRHGYLVPPENEQALAEAIERILSNPWIYDNMIENIKQLKATYPGWDSIAKMTIDVYEKCLR